MSHGPDFPEFTAQTSGVWDRLANWWDDKIGDGNPTQDMLVEPTQERLLALKAGEQVLDIACGAGRFTRRMAALGAHVLAFDHAPAFVERARRRTVEHKDRIEYRVMNATDKVALLSLGEKRFDAAVCTMAIMDMAEITPLLSALPRLLKPKGRFVWSVMHPVFNSGDAQMVAENHEEGTQVATRFSMKVGDYLTARVVLGIGIPGQPEQQHYFHRPVSMLLNACADAGMVVDRVEEPAFPPGAQMPSARPLSWANYTAIPQVLVVRAKISTTGGGLR